MGIRVYLQIILSTLPNILDFDSKVLASSMKRITEGLRPPRPFSARSYNRVSHADEILLDPSFLLGACTAPYLPEQATPTIQNNTDREKNITFAEGRKAGRASDKKTISPAPLSSRSAIHCGT